MTVACRRLLGAMLVELSASRLSSSSSCSSSSPLNESYGARPAVLRRCRMSSQRPRLEQRAMSSVKESGGIHLILGPMFAGKTTALLERVQQEAAAGRKVLLVKSDKDTRYGLSAVVSHSGKQMPCAAVSRLSEFRLAEVDAYERADVIGIDEAQFFPDLLSFCQDAADFDGKTLVVAGLDGDFLRRRFGSALDLIPMADTVTKLLSRCEICGKPAAFTFRKTDDRRTEVIAGGDVYMPVCRQHYVSGQVAIERARQTLLGETVRAAEAAP